MKWYLPLVVDPSQIAAHLCTYTSIPATSKAGHIQSVSRSPGRTSTTLWHARHHASGATSHVLLDGSAHWEAPIIHISQEVPRSRAMCIHLRSDRARPARIDGCHRYRICASVQVLRRAQCVLALAGRGNVYQRCPSSVFRQISMGL